MKQCYFCTNAIKEIDYKQVSILEKFLDVHGRVLSSKKSQTCASHQRRLATAVKRARFLALLPYLRG